MYIMRLLTLLTLYIFGSISCQDNLIKSLKTLTPHLEIVFVGFQSRDLFQFNEANLALSTFNSQENVNKAMESFPFKNIVIVVKVIQNNIKVKTVHKTICTFSCHFQSKV